MTPALDRTSLRLAAWLGKTAPGDASLWPTFAHDAGMRGVAGVILQNDAVRGLLPGEVTGELRRWSTRAAFENTHALRSVSPLIAALDRAGIRVMLLKGAALLQTIYDRPELRRMSDVDLLIHPDDALRAVDVLTAAECRRGSALVRSDFFPRFHYEVELFIPGPQPVRIDLHARPFRPMRLSRIIPDDAMWEDAAAVDALGARAYVPRPELLFLHLAAHAAFHGCSRLTWLYDLARFARRYDGELDWALLTRRCRDWRLGLAVRSATDAAQSLFGPFIPHEVAADLSHQPANWRDRLTLRQAPRDAQSPLRHVLCNMLTTPGIAFNAAYLWNMLTPDAGHLELGNRGDNLHGARLRRLFNVAGRTVVSVFARRRGPA